MDPRDFEASARHEFVVYRSVLRPIADRGSHGMTLDTPTAYAVKIGSLLDLYAGEGTGAKTRDFSFMTDANVLKIVERDYRELSLRTFPDGSWKSTVILAGSILEAVLYDLLTKDQTTITSCHGKQVAPTKKGGTTKDITQNTYDDEWRLNDLIKVACDLGELPHKDERIHSPGPT